MNPYYEHGGVSSYCGDNRAILAALPEKSVQTCVTSPPYFGQRDYGTATWEGGDDSCAHTVSRDDGDNKAVFGGRVNRGERTHCLKCNATHRDSQIGLEPTPDEYVAALVSVFRAVHRVLKDDGTCWINLGDSFCSQGGPQVVQTKSTNRSGGSDTQNAGKSRSACNGLKPKDLIGTPWMVAFALRADGWYLRSDIIWAKPNPMPESVTDRPTKAHEYLFLLSKSPKYYYDAAAIREPNCSPQQLTHNQKYAKPYAIYDERAADTGQPGNVNNVGIHSRGAMEGRNKRSVWTVATQPCSEAHFATFPQKLIEPCILAGSAEGDTVLDPFFGSGTTGLVARQLGRKCIGIDLNPDYLLIQKRRLNVAQKVLFEVAA